MKTLIEKLAAMFGKQLIIGKLSVSIGTIAITAATVLVVGGTAAAAVSINVKNAGQSETALVVEMQKGAGSEELEALDNSTNNRAKAKNSIKTDAEETAEKDADTKKETEKPLKTAHYHSLKTEVISESTGTSSGSAMESCLECDYVRSYRLPLQAHNSTNWIIEKAASETAEGLQTLHCDACGTLLATEVISIIPHSHNYVVTGQREATCSEGGYTEYTCSVCGDRIETGTIAKTSHDYSDWKVETAADCLTNGKEVRACKNCGQIESRIIPAVGHDYGEPVIVDSTCSVGGNKRYTCQRNGCSYFYDEVINKKDHTEWEWMIDIQPTCTEEGTKHTECTVCNAHIKEQSIPATGHTYMQTSYTAADCILEGQEILTCAKCSDTYTNTIPALGHTSGGWEITKEPTDLADGEKVRKCTVCGTTLETQVISKLPHICEFKTLLETQKATCTTDGYKLSQCKCGLTNKEILSKTNHANSEWKVIKEATYTELGLKQKVCKDCGYIVESQDIAVIPHEHNYQVTSATNPTCTEAGNTITTCSVCGHTKTAVLPATGHRESAAIVDTPATCTAEGTMHTTCSVCFVNLSNETIPPTGHTEGAFITDTEATCIENGSKHTQCDVCSATIKTETVPAKGHAMGIWNQGSAPACEADGTEEKSCGNCSYKESRSIPALGHDYGDWIIDVPPTEGNEGSKHKECSRCDSVITEDIEQLPPHVHTYTETGRVESTCTAAGSITYTCGCGNSYTEEITKKPHTPGEWTVKTSATEAATGLEVKTCTACGVETDSRVIDKLEHVHNYTTDVKAATCTVDGYEKKTCSCGSVVNKVLPATGHQYGEAVVVQPTCTTKGTSTITCSVCSNKVVTDIPAAGHNYVEKSKVPASCDAAGTVISECANCMDRKEVTIPKLEHSYAETSVIDATCTEGGYAIETCAGCGDTKKTKETAALGHTEGAWETVKEAELGVAGSKEQKCTICNVVLKTEEIPMLLTDGTDSVYWFENYVDGKYVQEMAIGHFSEDDAIEMLSYVNAHRTSIGKPELILETDRTSGKMAAYTDLRAVETSYLWDHTRPNGTATKYSENIALGPFDGHGVTVSVKTVFDAWMNSQGHKNNIEASRTNNKTGISVFYKKTPISNAPGRYVYIAYWVETFR